MNAPLVGSAAMEMEQNPSPTDSGMTGASRSPDENCLPNTAIPHLEADSALEDGEIQEANPNAQQPCPRKSRTLMYVNPKLAICLPLPSPTGAHKRNPRSIPNRTETASEGLHDGGEPMEEGVDSRKGQDTSRHN